MPHAGGRPLKFENLDVLKRAINNYFNDIPREEWTITGLALHLDTSRETLCNYQGKPEFFDAIKRGKDMVEHSYEVALRKNGRPGDIFALKNFGWVDKQEIDQHSTNINLNKDMTEMSEEELLNLLK